MIVAAAAAVLVTMKAFAARPLAATADPALKPNQPNHRRPAPEDRHRDVVRLHPVAVDDAPTDEQGDDRGRSRQS